MPTVILIRWAQKTAFKPDLQGIQFTVLVLRRSEEAFHLDFGRDANQVTEKLPSPSLRRIFFSSAHKF